MIIRYLHIKGVVAFPGEAYSPTVIYPDAVLSFPTALELLKLVSGRYSQVADCSGCIYEQQFPIGRSLGPLFGAAGTRRRAL
jgi:hypothetical protein